MQKVMVVLSLPANGPLIHKGPLDLPDNAPRNSDKGEGFFSQIPLTAQSGISQG